MSNAAIAFYTGHDTKEIYTFEYIDGKFYGNDSLKRGHFNPQSGRNISSCFYNNCLYLFYMGTNNDIHFSVRSPDGTWSGSAPIVFPNDKQFQGPGANVAPECVVHNDVIYLIYMDKRWRPCMIFFNGLTWEGVAVEVWPDNPPNPVFNDQPSAVSYGGRMWIYYKNFNSDQIYFVTFDKGNFAAPQPLYFLLDGQQHIATSIDCPAVAVFDRAIWIVWRGNDNKNLYYIRYSGGAAPPLGQVGKEFDITSSARPGIAVVGDRLLIVYRTSLPENSNMYSVSTIGSSNKWENGGKVKIEKSSRLPQTDHPPSLTSAPFVALSHAGDTTTLTQNRRTTNNWMSKLNDDIPIGYVNLPGSHDSAAKTLNLALTPTLYGTQNLSITEQLNRGVRLFDIRLRISTALHGVRKFNIDACHGAYGTSVNLNTYRPLTDYMAEIRAFLGDATQNREAIVVLIKIDDDTQLAAGDRQKAYAALQADLGAVVTSANMPTLGNLRGQIYVMSRIGNALGQNLGPLIGWADDTAGERRLSNPPTRLFDIYAQDQTSRFAGWDPTTEKNNLFFAAMDPLVNLRSAVLFNFANAQMYILCGAKINRTFIAKIGLTSKDVRPGRMGWCFFDYPDNEYSTDVYGDVSVIDLIIDSNFAWSDYPKNFNLL